MSHPGLFCFRVTALVEPIATNGLAETSSTTSPISHFGRFYFFDDFRRMLLENFAPCRWF